MNKPNSVLNVAHFQPHTEMQPSTRPNWNDQLHQKGIWGNCSQRDSPAAESRVYRLLGKLLIVRMSCLSTRFANQRIIFSQAMGWGNPCTQRRLNGYILGICLFNPKTHFISKYQCMWGYTYFSSAIIIFSIIKSQFWSNKLILKRKIILPCLFV